MNIRGILSIAIQIAFTVGFFAVLALTATGCEPAPPAGVELDAGPALDIILATYGSTVAHPRVVAVDYDCSDTHDGGTGYGFTFGGSCVGGATMDSGNVYIVVKPGNANRYSDHLAHEARHVAAGGDMDPHHTSPGFYADVARAQAALKASTLDMMPVGVVGLDRR